MVPSSCGFFSISGLHLKKLDKKLERTLLHSYRKVGLPVYGDTEIWVGQVDRQLEKLDSIYKPVKLLTILPFFIFHSQDLTSQVSAETDPVSLLAKVVSLLYVQVC